MAEDVRPRIEVIYEPPAATRATWWAALGAALFIAGVLWILARAMRSPWLALTAAVVMAALYAAQVYARRPKLLRTKRVVADLDARAVRVEHRGGVVTMSFDDIADIEAGATLMGEGISIDSVTIHRRGGEVVTFGVIHKEAADGAVRAFRAVLGVKEADAPAAAD